MNATGLERKADPKAYVKKVEFLLGEIKERVEQNSLF
jgi:hypothetical protein